MNHSLISDSRVTQVKKYYSHVYLNPSTFQAVMKLHLSESDLSAVRALIGNNKSRVNSSKVCWRVLRRDKGEATLSTSWSWCSPLLLGVGGGGIYSVKPASSIVLPAREMQRERVLTFSLHHKITLWSFLALPLHPPAPPRPLWDPFIPQTSVGKGESLISQGLSFIFHYWAWMQIWVTADAAVFFPLYFKWI